VRTNLKIGHKNELIEIRIRENKNREVKVRKS